MSSTYSSGSLTGKRVLITGAAQRIGRALALAAARDGADLVIHYRRSLGEAESLRAEIHNLGRRCDLLSADLSDPAQVAGLIPQALQAGPLYALVNNASLFAPLTWQQTDLANWNQHLMVNLTAPFFLSQSFARSLPEGETGRIVNLLDWRALRPGADHLPYTVSKSALAALTRSLAIALAPRITVNGLALGAALPPSDGSAQDEQQLKRILQDVPARRWAEIEEVGQALLFLLTGPAYITGEVLHLDGGRHLN
jgi:NAD(P)-dependent dehydrogenase (short-subunit alcohol dehydrogenase family)